MKRIILNLTLFALIFSMSACGGSSKEKKSDTANKPTATVNAATSTKLFGTLADGSDVFVHTLTNQNGMQVELLDFGAIIKSIKVPQKDGSLLDVTHGYDDLDSYIKFNNGPYFGSVVGRYGNRIARGKFTLDGKQYTLATNNELNHLHGGNVGFNQKLWKASEAKIDANKNSTITFSYLSKDMEEGYPGNLNVSVTYTLTNDNQLNISYDATTDKNTVVNLTQHSYFNLSGDQNNSILDHTVTLNCDKYVPVDKTLIPTGKLESVKGTPFDFTSPKVIGKDIKADNEQLKIANGYDHCWVVANYDGSNKLIAKVESPNTGIGLEVYTDQPGVQFYTANFLDGTIVGKNGNAYKQRSGFCLETQHFPDSPNQKNFPSTELKPGEKYHTVTSFKFTTK